MFIEIFEVSFCAMVFCVFAYQHDIEIQIWFRFLQLSNTMIFGLNEISTFKIEKLSNDMSCWNGERHRTE